MKNERYIQSIKNNEEKNRMSPIIWLINPKYRKANNVIEIFEKENEFKLSNVETTPYHINKLKSLNTMQKNSRGKSLLQSLHRKAKEIKRILPKIEDINIIDKYSRLVFPLLFFIFNLLYWTFYFVQNSYLLGKKNF